MDSLPVLNYGVSDRETLTSQIKDVMGDIGFLYVENIPGYDEEELRWCVDFFFGLTEEKRMELARKLYNPKNSNRYRGYFGINKHVGSSHKKGFELGPCVDQDDPEVKSAYPFYENNVWPQPDSDQDSRPFEKFRSIMERYQVLLYNISIDLLRLLSLALGLNENYFDSMVMPKHCSTFRIIYYPVHDSDVIPESAYSPDDGRLLSTAAHVDSTILTLLNTLNYEGLQVQMKDGTYMDVATRKNALVVNFGQTLSKMTGDRVKATWHRVLAIGRPRQSVPFFLEPGYHARIPKNLPCDPAIELSAGDHPEEDTFIFGEWARSYYQRFVEMKGFDTV